MCLYHDTSAWCTQTDLTDCPINQPLRNGDCKVPENQLTRMSGGSAESVGVYFGPEVRHLCSILCRVVPRYASKTCRVADHSAGRELSRCAA